MWGGLTVVGRGKIFRRGEESLLAGCALGGGGGLNINKKYNILLYIIAVSK
jgi:hypothetical protein